LALLNGNPAGVSRTMRVNENRIMTIIVLMNCLTRIHVRHTLNDPLNEVITDEWYISFYFYFLYLFNGNYSESQARNVV